MSYLMGDTVQSVCKTCSEPFSYAWAGTSRRYCPECKVLRAKASNLAQKERPNPLNLKPHQLSGQSAKGLQSIARCSQEEAAVFLSVLETLELQAKTGDSDAFVKPLSAQAVQQLERRALMKIEKAMRRDWESYEEGMIGKDQVIATPTSRSDSE